MPATTPEEMAIAIRAAHERSPEEACEVFGSFMTEKVEMAPNVPEEPDGLLDSATMIQFRKAEIQATRAALPEYRETLVLTVEGDVLNCVFTVTGRPRDGVPLTMEVNAQYSVRAGKIYRVAMKFNPEDATRLFALMSVGGFDMPSVDTLS